MLSDSVKLVANVFFLRISKDKVNAVIAEETVTITRLREFVVEQLRKIEDEDSLWWKNIELLRPFEEMYEAGIIFLPTNDLEKLRWVALICVACAEEEGFAYGNVLIPPDYLPDDKLAEYEEVYGVRVIDDVREMRNHYSTLGWKAHLGM